MPRKPQFKSGDKVAIVGRYGVAPIGPYTVKSLHARSGNVILAERNTSQYDSVTGWRRSSDRWPSGERIEIWSETHDEAQRRAKAVDTLRRFPWDRLPTDRLTHIAGMAKSSLPKPTEEPPATSTAASGPSGSTE